MRVVLSIILFFTLSITALGQALTTATPYSRFGLGDVHYNSIPRFMAMGSTGIALNDSIYINPDNPASYVSSGKFIVTDLGLRSNYTTLSTTTQRANTLTYNFSHLYFQLPIKTRKWGMAFGLKPFTNEGYRFSQQQVLGTDTFAINYSGSGGLNKFTWGNAFVLYRGIRRNAKILDDKTLDPAIRRLSRDTMPERSRLVLGLNSHVVFGALITNSNTQNFLENNGLETRQLQTLRVNGFTFDLGLQYTKRFKNQYALTLGGIYNIGTTLNARRDLQIYNFSVNPNFGEQVVEVFVNETNQQGTIVLPTGYGAGLGLRKGNKWLVTADYRLTNWQDFRSFGNPDDALANSYQAAMGAQYTPNPDPANRKRISLSRTAYRLGARYGASNLTLNNTQLTEWGISCGMGMLFRVRKEDSPLRFINRIPFYSLNLAFEYGQRGTTTNNLIKENFYRLSLSFTLTDKWFNKYLYD